MVKHKDTPGNAMESTLNYQRAMLRFAESVVQFEWLYERLFARDVELLGLTVRIPDRDGMDYLVTVRAQVEGQRVVGFHAGATLYETLEGTLNRLKNKSLKWKADQYAK